jgi:membrane protein YqaA with SNARE-associated domain
MTVPYISAAQSGRILAARRRLMRSLLGPLLGYFLSLPGLIVLAALDSSLIFFLPLGIDFVVIILTARHPEMFWLHAALASAGSAVGSSITFWLGWKLGEHGLTRLVSPARLQRVRRLVSTGAIVSIAALSMIPPPFPFTAFVLTSGALRINPWRFLGTLAAARFVRFFVEAAFAARYGRRILTWMESPAFEVMVAILIALAVIGTILSAIAVVRGTRQRTPAAVR